MVSVTVKKSYLLQLVGKRISDAQLSDSLFQVKAGCDDVSIEDLSLEVTGDRPDLLSAEGVARALKGHLGIEKGLPKLKMQKSTLKIICEPAALAVRPFIVGAVIENAHLTEDDVADLFQMQEKLDLTHGRKRKKISIGLYDMTPLQPPYYFKALDPDSTRFQPLKSDSKMSLRQILEKHDKGTAYAHLINQHKKYPCLVDSKGEILSLVPIINGVSTAVTAKSKTIFIDHTGSDLQAMNASLNILCQHFADRGAVVKSVEVVYPNKKRVTPDSTPISLKLSISDTNRLLGLSLSATQMSACLSKQRISSTVSSKDSLLCQIPAYRADFLHPVDLVEEVAMGYGYNSFQPLAPQTFTKGSLLEKTRLQDSLQDLMLGHGFQQIATHITTNPAKFEKSGDDPSAIKELVRITNPVSEEYSVLRSFLLPGMLEVLSKNTHASYPQKLFEIGEVVVKDNKEETNARTELHLCAVIANADANFSEISSVLATTMSKLKRSFKLEKLDAENKKFLEGRGANAIEFGGEQGKENKRVVGGQVGELHPRILEHWHLEVPVVVFELMLG